MEEQAPETLPLPADLTDALDISRAVRGDYNTLDRRLRLVEERVSSPYPTIGGSSGLPVLAGRISLAESGLNMLQRDMAESHTRALTSEQRIRELENFQIKLLGMAVAIGAIAGFLSHFFMRFLGNG